MTGYAVTIDTAERAATPAHDCGLFRLRCTEANVREQTEALVMLGFTPTVEVAQ